MLSVRRLNPMKLMRVLTAAALFLLLGGPSAMAHPHVAVTVASELIFNTMGRVTALRHVWSFDEVFSAFAVEGLDVNGDGMLTREELSPLAEINMSSLADYAFFTMVTLSSPPAPEALQNLTAFQLFFRNPPEPVSRTVFLLPPIDYWLEYASAKLTLHFTLPIDAPLEIGPHETLTLGVLDPEYVVAFDLAPEVPFVLVQAPNTCVTSYEPPGELGPQAAAALATIAPDQTVPADLLALTANLAHRFSVTCG